MKTFTTQRLHRHARVRSKLAGTAARPRLSVFRSNRHLAVQLIDDAAGRTLLAADTRAVKETKGKRPEDAGFTKVPLAFSLGELVAAKAQEKKITQVAFDRGGYRYAGRVRALAEGARAGGLIF